MSGDLATWVGSVGTVLALLVAGLVALSQFRSQNRQHLVERTLAAHRDLTTGEAWAARDRLSEFMWRVGTQDGVVGCWQPSYPELSGPLGEVPADAAPVRDLSRYPIDIQPADGQTPFRDLYLILWQFERVGVAYGAGLLDPDLAMSMIASHVVWWDTFCARIGPQQTRYRQSLATLAGHFAGIEPELTSWANADFVPTT